MSNIVQAIRVELLKARRSRIPLLTALGFSFAPLVGGFFMVIMKDPALARRLGIISAKAQIVAGSADWPTYLGILAQATAIGGILLFGLIGSWVFGREYSDRTVKDLLALPTPRFAIVLAKFVLVLLWSAALTVVVCLIGIGVGIAVGLPPASTEIIRHGALNLAITACLTISLVTPIAFFAVAGRGYLLPMGVAILMLILAQIIAAAGWGEYFSWSIPALYSGMAGPEYANLGPISFILVLLTSLVGIVGTIAWLEYSDQTQ
jgi:ABC-2 type transport system permease protein